MDNKSTDKATASPLRAQFAPFSLLFDPAPTSLSPSISSKIPEHDASPSLAAHISAISTGTPYVKHDWRSRTRGNIVISAPLGLYPALALIPTLCVLPEFDTIASHVVGFGPMFIASVGSVVAQIIAVVYINIIADEKEDTSTNGDFGCTQGGTSFALRLVCLIVFIMVQLSEIKSAIEFLDYVLAVPLVSPSHASILRERNVKVLTSNQSVRDDKGKEFQIEGFAAGGFTPFGRMWALTWAFIDGTVNAIVLLYGSVFVLYSGTNEELILNAVALNFISKIDDTCYDFIITKMVKEWVEGLPQVGLVVNGDMEGSRVGKGRLIAQILGQWLQLITLAIATLICWRLAC